MGWDGTLTSPLAPQVRGVPGVDPRGALSQLGQLHGPRAGQHQALLLLHHRYEARREAQSLRSSLPHPQLPACVRESSARAPSPVPTSTPPARSRLRWFTARARLPPSPPLPLNTFFSLSSIPKIKPCSSPLGVRSPPPLHSRVLTPTAALAPGPGGCGEQTRLSAPPAAHSAGLVRPERLPFNLPLSAPPGSRGGGPGGAGCFVVCPAPSPQGATRCQLRPRRPPLADLPRSAQVLIAF